MEEYTVEDIDTRLDYVTHTCKNCKRAFIDVDRLNAQVEPPDYKYCPECVKLGFKNTKENKDTYKSYIRVVEHMYNWQAANKNASKEDIDFIYKKCLQKVKEYREFGKKINTSSIFKEALEILSYHKEEQENG